MLIVVTAEESTEGSSSGVYFWIGKLEIPTPILEPFYLILAGDF